MTITPLLIRHHLSLSTFHQHHQSDWPLMSSQFHVPCSCPPLMHAPVCPPQSWLGGHWLPQSLPSWWPVSSVHCGMLRLCDGCPAALLGSPPPCSLPPAVAALPASLPPARLLGAEQCCQCHVLALPPPAHQRHGPTSPAVDTWPLLISLLD